MRLVSFPPLWDTPSLLWVQYDASIFNELVRNAGESLGVTAKINMTGADPGRHFSSSIQLATMAEMEKMLRGADPLAGKAFNGLTAPKWSDAAKIFGKGAGWDLDDAKVDRGRDLYRTFCVECHRGPVQDAKFDSRWPDVSFWASTSPDRTEPNWVQIGDRNYFNVVQKPVADMGTAGSIARSHRTSGRAAARAQRPPGERSQQAMELPHPRRRGAQFLVRSGIDGGRWPCDRQVVRRESDRSQDGRGDAGAAAQLPQSAHAHGNAKDGQRRGTERDRAALPGSAARRCLGDGALISTMARFPRCGAMLTPQKDRPSKFCVGSRQFDPAAVGLKIDVPPCATGLTEIDTSELGNSNAGHSFEGMQTDIRKLPPGVIGRALNDGERDDLVEYLKTL